MLPDPSGHFGIYGGKYIPETLIPAVEELAVAYKEACGDPSFQAEFNSYLRDYVGRPTPLYFARRLTETLGGAKIYLKREDLCHTGAHKINNSLGQALLARRMGKKRVTAETGAGQHGVAVATAAALLNLTCEVYMGEVDIRRQSLNVFRMELLGARVIPVRSGSRTLKDATNEAIRDWVTNVRTTHYIIGSVVGPHPYPLLVRDFQAIIGKETKVQLQELEGRLPDYIVACVGGGSNALGIFYPFLEDPVALLGVEAAGRGLETGKHAASLTAGKRGVLHGAFSYVLQDTGGQISLAHSVSAGLDYPGVGPEHSYLKDTGRVSYTVATDEEALAAFQLLARTEGILPALESAHALAAVVKLAPQLPPEKAVVVNLSGRGDKDVEVVAELLGSPLRALLARQEEAPAQTKIFTPALGRQGEEKVAKEGKIPLMLKKGSDSSLGTARICACFKELSARKEKALIPYLCAGDPDFELTSKLVLTLQAAGANLLELGVPFSDPLADGPVIQAASQRALRGGATLARILSLVSSLRSQVRIPLLLMSYFNPLLQFGLPEFVREAKEAGVDGFIVPDLPPEEGEELWALATAAGLCPVPLVAPTTTPDRLAKLARLAPGFIYCVSVTGVTGARESLPPDLATFLTHVREVTSKPLAVGFGISKPEQVQGVAPYVEGVIVGSAFVDLVAQSQKEPSGLQRAVETLTRALKAPLLPS